MERIYYRVLQLVKKQIYTIYWFKSLFIKRRTITETDYKNLNLVFKYFERKYPFSTNSSYLLFKYEIGRAIRKKDGEIPNDIVKMGANVTFKNILTGEILNIQLVYPNQEQLRNLKLSVFSAVGMALFAQKSGTTIDCFEGNRKIQIQILSIN